MSTSTSLSKTGLNDDNVIFTPNESEVERLDKQHKVVHAAMPQLVLAPVDLTSGGKRILDQATGSGIWLRDVRQAAGVNSNTWVGTDIEDSYFPTENPADTSYYHQSMTEPWPKSWHGTFDLVHSRMALPGVGHFPLDQAVKNLVGLVKPGGWVQMVEMEWQDWEGGPVLGEFQTTMTQFIGMVTNGQGVGLRERLTTQLQEAGLEKMQYSFVKVPVGAKANDEVRELSLQTMFATASFAIATLQKVAPDMVDDKLKTLPTRLREELQNAGGCFNLFAMWAQKPAQS